MKYIPYLELRPATLGDAKLLFDWKNDPDVRKWSIESKDKINFDKHLKWLAKNLQNINIISDRLKDYGDVRIDNGNEIAIKIDKQYRGYGVGAWVLRTYNDIYPLLIAKVVDGNIPSMNLFIKHDYKAIEHKIENDVGFYILKYEDNTNRI